jgi:hypothetical protein
MRRAKKPRKQARNALNEKHAYFPRKTHKNTKNMRFPRENRGLLQNATPPTPPPPPQARGVLPAKTHGSLHGELAMFCVFFSHRVTLGSL